MTTLDDILKQHEEADRALQAAGDAKLAKIATTSLAERVAALTEQAKTTQARRVLMVETLTKMGAAVGQSGGVIDQMRKDIALLKARPARSPFGGSGPYAHAPKFTLH